MKSSSSRGLVVLETQTGNPYVVEFFREYGGRAERRRMDREVKRQSKKNSPKEKAKGKNIL